MNIFAYDNVVNMCCGFYLSSYYIIKILRWCGWHTIILDICCEIQIDEKD